MYPMTGQYAPKNELKFDQSLDPMSPPRQLLNAPGLLGGSSWIPTDVPPRTEYLKKKNDGTEISK